MLPVTEFNYKFPKDKLQTELDHIYKRKLYKESELGIDFYNLPYPSGILNKTLVDFTIHYNIISRCTAYYYVIEPNRFLIPHLQQETSAAVNIMLDNNYMPISFTSGEYYCNQAAIDVQDVHWIRSSKERRMALRFSFYDLDYEQLVRILNAEAY